MSDPARPRILLFTGDGKGKTTAALGMVLRASGHGLRTLVVQFIKANKDTGELIAAKQLPGVEIVQCGKGFVPDPQKPAFAKHKEAAEKGLARVHEAAASGQYKLLVLDEVCTAVAKGLLADSAVVPLATKLAPDCILVLTGRGATQALIDLADTATEMRCIKHGFAQGRNAQRGVEL
jgi:cob(I)alamin adenosyltransferase